GVRGRRAQHRRVGDGRAAGGAAADLDRDREGGAGARRQGGDGVVEAVAAVRQRERRSGGVGLRHEGGVGRQAVGQGDALGVAGPAVGDRDGVDQVVAGRDRRRGRLDHVDVGLGVDRGAGGGGVVARGRVGGGGGDGGGVVD